tara:strand:- start:2288 stop:3112 length:825 start_codon:yes stop_codon:yes gene_type:complete
MTPQYDLAHEVKNQNNLIRILEEDIIKNPADKIGDLKKLRKSRNKIVLIEKEILERNRILEDKENFNWKKFTDLIKILNYFGCLENLDLTNLGKSISTLRTENELWVGMVLVSGYLDDLEPPELAAVIQAISVEVRRPDHWCNFKSSIKVNDVLNELEGLKKLISNQQRKYLIDAPIHFESELTGIISEWTKGKKWRDIVFNTSLDEGDIVRIMRRTIDVLSQIKYCLSASNKLKRNANLTLKAINRFPVSESDELFRKSEANNINPATERIDN